METPGIQPLSQPIAKTPSIAPAASPASPPPAPATPAPSGGWSFRDVADTGLQWLNKGVNAVSDVGKAVAPQLQQAGLMSSVMPALQKAAPQLLHALMPMGGVLRSGGLPAIAGMAGFVRGKNTMAPLFEGPSAKDFGQQAAAASQTPGG